MVEWLELAVLLQMAWVQVLAEVLQAELWQLQVLAGAGECGEPMRIVRGGHEYCQKADEVKAVAGAGDGSQLLAVRA